MIFTDSDVIIEVLRGRNPEIVDQWRAAFRSDDIIACSPITAAELWCGRRSSEATSLNAMLSSLKCPEINEETGRIAGDLVREYGRSHGVELADALIAAGCIQHEAQLWTRNRKHFPSRKLRFYNPGRIH